MSMFSSRLWALKQTFKGIFQAKSQFVMAVLLSGLTLTIPVFMGTLLWSASEPLIHVPLHTEITVFADRSAGAASVKRLDERIAALPDIATTRVVPKKDALAMVNDSLGLRAQENAHNPLPDIVIATVHQQTSSEAIAAVVKSIESLESVDMVAYDDKWAQHVTTLISTIGVILGILGSIIVALVGIVIAASVRLTTYAQRDEIAALHIFGASNTFIARPYVWRGFITLALSASLSLGLTYSGLLILQEPLAAFATLYGVSLTLAMPSIDWCLLYVALAAVLGSLIGAGTASAALRQMRKRTF